MLILGSATQISAAPLPAAPSAATPARLLAGSLKARLSYDPLTGYGLLEKSGNRLAFALGSALAIFNWNRTIPLDPPQEMEAGLSFSAASSAIRQHAS